MMAFEPQSDRLKLEIEPEPDDTANLGALRDPDEDSARQRRPEDMIDLERFDKEEEFGEEQPPRRRRMLPVTLAVVALIGFGAVTWYAYTGVIGTVQEEALPVIRADAGPIKSRPAAPGGMEVPYQDRLVLNEITPDPDKPQVERLLPPPEVPKPPKPRASEAAPGIAPGTAGTDRPAGQDVAEAAKPGQAPGDLAPAAGAPPGATGAQAAKPAIPPLAPPSPATSGAPVAEALGTPAKEIQTAAAMGAFLVQFASLKDKNLAGPEWARLQKAFPNQLSGKKLVLQTVDLGSRGTFHRVRAGYFADRASAAALCKEFQAKNQACIVVKP